MTRKYVRVGLAEVVDPHHVFVQQPGGDLGLQPQPLADLLAALFLEHLDRDAALQDLVGRRIDRPHAATAQLLFQEKSLVERRADADHRGAPTAVEVGRPSWHAMPHSPHVFVRYLDPGHTALVVRVSA